MPATIDVRDLMVTQPGQVIDDEPDSPLISGANDIDVVGARPTTDQDDRNAGRKIIKLRLGELRAEQDQ